MKPALDRNTIKTAIRGAYEIDAWARDEPIDVYRFEEHGRLIGREAIWIVPLAEGSIERIHSTKLYTLDAFELIISAFGFEDHAGARPVSDSLVSMLSYNTGASAPVPHAPGARYEGDVRIDLNRPWSPKIIERQHDLLEQMEQDEPGITRESSERARAAYLWVRDTL